jgi:hypothetical protein
MLLILIKAYPTSTRTCTIQYIHHSPLSHPRRPLILSHNPFPYSRLERRDRRKCGRVHVWVCPASATRLNHPDKLGIGGIVCAIDYRCVARYMRSRAAHTTHPRGSYCTTLPPPQPCMCQMNRQRRSRHLGPYSRHCTGSQRRSRSRPATRTLP